MDLLVNGVPRSARVPARRLLSDLLRHDLRLTGTHVGCEHGVCGACTVLLDGRPVRSCLVFAVSVDGAEVTTIEGCTRADGELGTVQQAFWDCHGLQCGFCTPGFVTTITAFLAEHPEPTEAEARQAIAGNLCRCTGYQNIVAAVLRAAELRNQHSAAELRNQHSAAELRNQHSAAELRNQHSAAELRNQHSAAELRNQHSAAELRSAER